MSLSVHLQCLSAFFFLHWDLQWVFSSSSSITADAFLTSLHINVPFPSLLTHFEISLSVSQHRKPVWYPGIIWGCVIIIALLPAPCSHGFSCMASSMPILWLDLLSSGAKNTKITIFPPLICSLLHSGHFSTVLYPHVTHVSDRVFSWAGHHDPAPHFIIVFSMLGGATHSMVDSFLAVHMTIKNLSSRPVSLSHSLSLSLCLSLSVPSSMWTLARVFIRGLPAELQQAFPGEEATGSRRMIKLGHYWASTGPQGSLPPSS